MVAKYSYGVWERFAHQANLILKYLLGDPKSRSDNNFRKCLDLGSSSWGTKIHTLGKPATGGIEQYFHTLPNITSL